jgi:5-methylcytosine-specific restriction enzyme A
MKGITGPAGPHIQELALRGSIMAMVIFKTDAGTLPGVVAHSKHALYKVPTRLEYGDTILVAQTIQSLLPGQKQIRYCMTFVRSYRDTLGESDKIWGKHWGFIVEGANLKELSRPFNIAAIRSSSKNYGQGGPVVYVHPLDEKAIKSGGYL